MKKSNLIIFLIIGFMLGTSCSSGKGLFSKKKKKTVVQDTRTPIEKFFKDIPTIQKGLFTIYNSKGKYYLEIQDSLLHRDLLMVTRLSKAPANLRSGFSGYAGDHVNTAVIRFEKAPNNNILLRKVLSVERADSTGDMYQAVQRSSFLPIIGLFDVKAALADSSRMLIEINRLFESDNEELFLEKNMKNGFEFLSIQPEKTYISSTATYPINTEIRTIKTYLGKKGVASFELNSSIIMLPETPMRPRYWDERVGYFSEGYIDYDKNPQGVDITRLITRWRLEPKPEDQARYEAGELVEPAKPIIYYIDPATPSKWIPYLIQGVNDWEPVFRAAGFKNAIMAKRAPTKEEDSTWSLEDARYSAIVYKPSTIPNASGPHVRDPRSGEILESHVNWYHNVMSLLHNWYFIQCAAVDTAARKMIFSDSLMGQLIRFVSSHEIGHTLGMRHNFAASSAYPVEKLRDKNFIKEHGHTASIMDYCRFNYVAQPEDSIGQSYLFPGIGKYDHWCIEWGYRLFPQYKTPQEEVPMLNQWIIEKTKDRYLWFGSETAGTDPRSQSEDLGDNQMIANAYGIKNLNRIITHLDTWTLEPNKGYQNLKVMYSEIINQYLRYAGHAIKWIGGIYQTPKTVEQEGVIYEPAEKEKQQEAISFIIKNYIETPQWVFRDTIMQKIGTDYSETAVNITRSLVQQLLQRYRIINLLESETLKGKTNAYTVEQYFNDLNNAIFKETSSGGTVDMYRRTLQKTYVKQLLEMLPSLKIKDNVAIPLSTGYRQMTYDVNAIIYYQLQQLQKKLQNATTNDMVTKAHYQFLNQYIKQNIES